MSYPPEHHSLPEHLRYKHLKIRGTGEQYANQEQAADPELRNYIMSGASEHNSHTRHRSKNKMARGLAKGLAVLLLITGGYWFVSSPLKSSLTSQVSFPWVKVDADTDDGTSTVSVPSNTTESSIDAEQNVDILASSSSASSSISTTDTENDSVTSGNNELRLGKLPEPDNSSADDNRPDTQATGDAEQQPESVTTNTTIIPANDTDTISGTVTIKAYSASMFSHPSNADATESRVARGATVNLLGKHSDWIKIRVVETNEVGYMHKSLLLP